MSISRVAAAAAIAALAVGAHAGVLDEQRLTTPAQLSIETQRLVLENGLVVVLAPDPSAAGVAVWTTFRAGALREPAGKTGLAHLVEHLVFSGKTPETDYAALLEARRAHALNAGTGFETMTFQVVVPAEELPLALWVMADRLVTRAPRIDAREVERERRVIQQERALRFVDAPYGLAHEQLFRRLYAPPHPLRGGVIGVPDELAAVDADDVHRFVEAYLVPSNGILVVAGRFDPPVARAIVARTLGRLPAGQAPRLAALPPPGADYVDAQPERLARTPRVTFAWRVPGTGPEDAAALRLGAQLLSAFVDGAWGMRIGAEVVEYEGEALFAMDLTVPYDEPMRVVHADADGFLRQLTHKELPIDFLIAANRALDRIALTGLDGVAARAEALTEHELRTRGRVSLAEHLGSHWQLDGSVLRDTARRYLRGPRLVLHARPERPRKARADRE
jgi:predicted Zn-dependent peptidase